jgi:hypothetical protein
VYDNLKSVVLWRRGAEVTFNPAFLPFADRYEFRPLPTWPGEPHEKGLVERPILYLKNNFCLHLRRYKWAGRKFAGMEDLHGQGMTWRDRKCNVRIHSGLDERPIDRFELERSRLLALPPEPPGLRLGQAIRRRRSSSPRPAVGATCGWTETTTRSP